jgi:SNF2 family DNA or RNA helicase
MLNLRFSTTAGKIAISCDEERSNALQVLRRHFHSAASLSNVEFETELDDFLVNLRQLAAWAEFDTDFRWQDELVKLVESNAHDAGVLEAMLCNGMQLSVAIEILENGSWNAPLTGFQKTNIAKLLSMEHGANFSVPGAGKTRVTLAVFHARRAAGAVRRMLVVCPKAAFESWESETRECFKVSPVRVTVMDTGTPPPGDIVLVNYERLPVARAALINWLRLQPALLVLDEAHRMKLGPSGAWGAACLSLGPYAANRMILTGTPAPNGAKDLENLFTFVWPGQGRRTVANALAANDLAAASRQLRPLFCRTTKADLCLPPVDVVIRRIPLPPLHRELYNALLGQLSGKWRGGEADMEELGKIMLYLLMAATTPALLATGASRHEPLPFRVPPLSPPPGSSLGELMRDLPQYELSPKYMEILKIVSENAANGRKTLVWSTFVRNLRTLESLLTRFEPALVHGGSLDRAEQLHRFRTDPRCFVLLSNPATLGEGVSLHHECHDAVYVDRDFSAGRYLQSLDRIHRLGLEPETRTQIHVLVAEETIDELIEQRLAAKLLFMGGILDDPAVTELADLVEEPSETIGMDAKDRQELLRYLSVHATF